MLTYAGVLGYHADHTFLGLPRQSLTQQLGHFFRLDGLVFLGVQALILGTLAFAVGLLLRKGSDLVRAPKGDHTERG